MLNYGMKTDLSEAQEGCGKMNHDRVMDILNRMIIEIDEALIKAKAQMEYLDDREIDLMKLGFDEDDIISGDLMRDEQ